MSDTRHMAATGPVQTGTAATGPTDRPDVVTEPQQESAWLSVVVFGGVMLLVGGGFHAIMGLVALFDPGYYLVSRSGLVVTVDFTSWGWVHLILGGLAILTGIGVLGGRTWARVLGIVLASVSALVNVAFVAAYPLWTMLLVAVDVLVIYALAAHGRELRDS